jgi:hypothetical protein
MQNPVPPAEKNLHDVLEDTWYPEYRKATAEQLEIMYAFHQALGDKYRDDDIFASALHYGLAAVAAAHRSVYAATKQIVEGGPNPFDED